MWFTLLYLRPPDQRALERDRRIAWAAPLVDAGIERERAHRTVARLEHWAGVQESRGWTPSIDQQAAWLARALRVRVPGPDVGEALDSRLLAARVRVAPGAIRSLQRLKDGGIRLGIVSNVLHETPQGLRSLLERLGLLPLFGRTILSSEHPWAKPRPEPFRLAMSGLGAPPESGAHVGDLLYDVIGSRRAGLRPLLFTGLHRLEPRPLRTLVARVDARVPRFSRWDQLPGLLARGTPARDGTTATS